MNAMNLIKGRLMLIKRKPNYEKSLYFSKVKKGFSVLDLGANQGYFSSIFAQLVGPNGSVHCFEPIPENIKILKEKIKDFQFVKVNQLAVGNQQEKVHMLYSTDELEKASLVEKPSSNDLKTINVEVTTIDQYLENNHLENLDFIKCDVEGYELNAIEGMQSTVQNHKPQLSIEISIPIKQRKILFNLLISFGYDLFRKIEKGFPSFDPSMEIPDDHYFYLHATSSSVT